MVVIMVSGAVCGGGVVGDGIGCVSGVIIFVVVGGGGSGGVR